MDAIHFIQQSQNLFRRSVNLSLSEADHEAFYVLYLSALKTAVNTLTCFSFFFLIFNKVSMGLSPITPSSIHQSTNLFKLCLTLEYSFVGLGSGARLHI